MGSWICTPRHYSAARNMVRWFARATGYIRSQRIRSQRTQHHQRCLHATFPLSLNCVRPTSSFTPRIRLSSIGCFPFRSSRISQAVPRTVSVSRRRNITTCASWLQLWRPCFRRFTQPHGHIRINQDSDHSHCHSYVQCHRCKRAGELQHPAKYEGTGYSSPSERQAESLRQSIFPVDNSRIRMKLTVTLAQGLVTAARKV